MSDETGPKPRVFVSYAYASGDRVGVLAKALEAEGFEVWRDHGLNPGDDYRIKIEAGLKAADAVLVCWTPAATVSDWVISEADDARQRDKLLPVMLQTCSIPKPFDRLHAPNLSKWTGNPTDPAFQKLVEAIRAKAEGREPAPIAWRRKWLTIGGASFAAGAVLTAVVNFADVKQGFDSVFNPAATEKTLIATDAKVDQVLALLKAKAERPIDAGSETVMRESIARLLSAQEGARGSAAEKLDVGDIDGAISELQAATEESVVSLVGALKELGALAFPEHTAEALLAYERVAQLASDDLDSRIQLGQLRMRLGHFDEAERAFLFVAENAPDDDWVESAALAGLGSVALQHDDLARAEKYFAEALRINESLDDVLGQSAGHVGLGIVQQTRGEYSAAARSFQRALDIQVRFGDADGQAAVHRNLGILSLERGELETAERLLNKALALSEDMEGRTTAIGGLAEIAGQRGDAARARELSEQGLALAEKISAHRQQALFLVALGQLAAQRGDRMEAIQRYQAAQEIYRFMEQDDEVKEMAGRMKALGAAPHPEGPEN